LLQRVKDEGESLKRRTFSDPQWAKQKANAIDHELRRSPVRSLLSQTPIITPAHVQRLSLESPFDIAAEALEPFGSVVNKGWLLRHAPKRRRLLKHRKKWKKPLGE
jgi:hypothetical protein